MKLFKNLFAIALLSVAFCACEDVPAPYILPGENSGNSGGSTIEGVYINESFASGLGVFTTEETVGEYPWVIDYSTAKATSFVDNTNNPAESWLIATPVDFTEETEAYATFEYIIRYSESGKVAQNHQFLISTDYAGDAAAATWTNLDYKATEGSDWTTFSKANIDIPSQFMGKSNIVFAFKYTATTKSGTWEVRKLSVAKGKAPVSDAETPSEAKEYTVTEALAAYQSGKQIPAIVTGYIVGTINGQVYESGCVFSGSATTNTNILIAATADETDQSKCIPVQLPSGAVRSGVNLVDNPGHYKKQVTLTGSLEKYFGVAGLKTVTKYSIEGQGSETETPEVEGAYIYESFATTMGSFTTVETVGEYPWINDYNTAKATAYVNNADNAAESWLVSPAIDLSSASAAYIAFEYIIRYSESGKVADNHQLLISDDYNGDVTTATWTNIEYSAVEGADWITFAKANVAVPTAMIGKNNVTIALKYTATTKAGTWEVKNFVVAQGEAGSNDGSDEGNDDGDEPIEIANYTVTEAMAAYVDGSKISANVTGYIVGTVNGQAFESGAQFKGEATSNTNLILADTPDETDPSKCIPVQLPSGAVRNALNLVDNPDNYKKQVTLTGSIEKYFRIAGLKSVTTYSFTE
ncbi:MAG: choice-of-anchor J domain-containing protein [Bacteroidaceae bacterium]|nr:choice-of-anchor J domain-containing protein [Bacteroidaceae bacterium]